MGEAALLALLQEHSTRRLMALVLYHLMLWNGWGHGLGSYLSLPYLSPHHCAHYPCMSLFPTSVPSCRANSNATTSEKPSWQLKPAKFSSLWKHHMVNFVEFRNWLYWSGFIYLTLFIWNLPAQKALFWCSHWMSSLGGLPDLKGYS